MNASDRQRRLRKALLVAPALLLLCAAAALSTTRAGAQTAGTQPTAIGVAAPDNVTLGQTVSLQAKLVGVAGAPIPKQRIDFTTSTSFLQGSGDMVLAQATTDATGLALAQFVARQSGTLTITAAFAGDNTYAAAKGNTQVTVSGSQQLYTQQAGVSLPGLNGAPGSGLTTGVVPHWFLSGWPIAAVLLVVWSLYGTAVLFLSQIPARAGEPAAPEQPSQQLGSSLADQVLDQNEVS
jgi:Bacterial Ig-like domain (group 3)